MPMIVLHATKLAAWLSDTIGARRTAASVAVPSVFLMVSSVVVMQAPARSSAIPRLFRVGGGGVFSQRPVQMMRPRQRVSKLISSDHSRNYSDIYTRLKSVGTVVVWNVPEKLG